MTVRRGRDWGHAGALPQDGVVAAGDAEVRALVEEARLAGRPLPAVGLLGGDLCRTLGGRGDEARIRSPRASVAVVDVARAVLDGTPHWFVAHLVARRRWTRGRAVALMNAEFLGPWDVAPRAHPGDGRLDLLDARLGPRDRLEARRRLPSGTHVPHPGIHERRVSAWETTFDPPLRVRLDGHDMGLVRHLSVGVEPDALTVVV